MSYNRVFGAKRRKGATRKPTKWWLFRGIAWRPFAPPYESTTLFMRRLFASCLSYLCLAGRKVATRKPAKITKLNSFKQLDYNSCSLLTRWCRSNASALGARGPRFNFRLPQVFLCLIFLFCCCCAFTFLSQTHYLSQYIYMFLQF